MRFRSVMVLVGADLCVRPIALVMLPKVGVVRERPLQKEMILAFPRHSGKGRNPERTGVDGGKVLVYLLNLGQTVSE